MKLSRRQIRPEKTGVRAPLGALEIELMRPIWRCGAAGCLAAELHQELSGIRPVALTTILTTLDRLFQKGILMREKEGKAYRYRAALSEEQLQQRIVGGVLSDLITQFPQAVAAYLAGQPGTDSAARSESETRALAEMARHLKVLRDSAAASEEDGQPLQETQSGHADD